MIALVVIFGLIVVNAISIYDGIQTRRKIKKLERDMEALKEGNLDKLLLG